MVLTVTLRDKFGDDFVRIIEVNSALDFAQVERAAAAWAKRQVRAMPLYGPAKRRELVMALEWTMPAPGQTLTAQRTVTIKLPRKKRRK